MLDDIYFGWNAGFLVIYTLRQYTLKNAKCKTEVGKMRNELSLNYVKNCVSTNTYTFTEINQINVDKKHGDCVNLNVQSFFK